MSSPAVTPPSRIHERPPFSDVAQGLAGIDRSGPEQLSADALRDDIRWFTERQRTLEAIMNRWLAELDRRPGRCTEWLGDALQMTPNAAYKQLLTARALDGELRLTTAALHSGEISPQHVTSIRMAMEQVGDTCLEPAAVESELVAVGKRKDPFEVTQHWKQMRYMADQPAAEAAEEAQQHQSWLSLTKTWWDTYQIVGELDAETGATLHTALRAIMGRKAKNDHRTPQQRRAAALRDLARRALDAGELPSRGGERPHLTLVANVETLKLEPGSPMAQLDWGPLVTGKTARRIAEDASVTPVLVDDVGNVLHVGRRSRTVPAPVRRALNLRDRGCQSPGCTMPPDLCAPHHKRHWADGGGHELSNLELRCDFHHGERHPENARFRNPARGSPSG